jgi:hypothetical protein
MYLIAPVSATPMRSDVAVLLGMDSIDSALPGNTFAADVDGNVAQRSQLGFRAHLLLAFYADDIDSGQGGVLQGKLRDFSGCTHVSLIRSDWITVAASLRCADNHSAAAHIEEIIDAGAGDSVG